MIDVIAIDGPVGVGKSAVARGVAGRLGWRHLDTGAMYRVVALAALRAGGGTKDAAACARLAGEMAFEFRPGADEQEVWMGGEDVTREIRSTEVTRAVSDIADQPAVRSELGELQKRMGRAAPSVAEGRDMGSVVFPDARWKIYLDADPRERVRRRVDQMLAQGREADEAEIAASIAERDRRDRTRPVGALRVCDDAVILDTTGIGLERVIEIVCQLAGGAEQGS